MAASEDSTRSSRGPAPRPRVLIVDDDERLSELLKDYLAQFSFSVRTSNHPDQALRLIKADTPDLLVLDVMLPGTDGLTLCRKIREFSRIPIIMLTARGDVADRVVGLEMGADDYLPKPFEPRELVARMQAVLRRGVQTADEIVKVGRLEVNWSTRSVRLDSRAIALTTAEFELLALLVRSRGRVLSRDRIMEALRGVDWEAYDRSIDVLVSRLRQKLGDQAKQSKFIQTVRGVGYSFTGGGRG
jgi:DNA-binding response OmpR family regulator